MTFWSDPIANYKAAPLWWPGSDKWDDGEIDHGEGDLNGTISAFNHYPGSPEDQDEFKTPARFTDKHTAVTE